MTPKKQKISIILLIIGISISAMILIPLAFFHDEQQKKLKSLVESQQKTEPWMDEFANVDQSDFESLVHKSKAEKFRILEHSCSDWFSNNISQCGGFGNEECIKVNEYDKRRDMCFYSIISEQWDYWDECEILYNNYVTQEEKSPIVNVIKPGIGEEGFHDKYCYNDLEFIENKRLEYNGDGHDFNEDTFNQMVDDVVQSRIESGCITMEKTSTGEFICVAPSIVPKIIEIDFAQISDEIIEDKGCIGKGWPDNPIFTCFDSFDEARSTVVCDDPDETCVWVHKSPRNQYYFPKDNIGCDGRDVREGCTGSVSRPYCMMYEKNNNNYNRAEICYKNERELSFFGCDTDNGTCYFNHGGNFNKPDTYYQSSDGCAISTNHDECKVFE